VRPACQTLTVLAIVVVVAFLIGCSVWRDGRRAEHQRWQLERLTELLLKIIELRIVSIRETDADNDVFHLRRSHD
jgi:heme/copper-type cytochrome/quinol oxidase subunit 2